MDYLRSLFGAFSDGRYNVGVRWLLCYSLWISAHFIAADHRGRSRAEVVKRALRWLEET